MVGYWSENVITQAESDMSDSIIKNGDGSQSEIQAKLLYVCTTQYWVPVEKFLGQLSHRPKWFQHSDRTQKVFGRLYRLSIAVTDHPKMA